MTQNPFIIIGAGGHAHVVIDLIQVCGFEILGIVDSNPKRHNTDVLGVPVLGDDAIILEHNNSNISLANGVGAIAKRDETGLAPRTDIYTAWRDKGYRFPPLIHPSAVISPHSIIHSGAQIMAGAILQAGTCIGENSIINTRASIDHDNRIGAHSHIAPSVTLCGNVNIGRGVYVGAGALVFQGVQTANEVVIAGGDIVRKNSDIA